jgi:hypothetical protein
MWAFWNPTPPTLEGIVTCSGRLPSLLGNENWNPFPWML